MGGPGIHAGPGKAASRGLRLLFLTISSADYCINIMVPPRVTIYHNLIAAKATCSCLCPVSFLSPILVQKFAKSELTNIGDNESDVTLDHEPAQDLFHPHTKIHHSHPTLEPF